MVNTSAMTNCYKFLNFSGISKLPANTAREFLYQSFLLINCDYIDTIVNLFIYSFLCKSAREVNWDNHYQVLMQE